MKLSEYIQELQKTLELSGDCYLLRTVIETDTEGMEWKMVSKTRKDKNGVSLKMTHKEFLEYIKEQEQTAQ